MKENEKMNLIIVLKSAGKHVSREEYLLGRKVDASLDMLNQEESKQEERFLDSSIR